MTRSNQRVPTTDFPARPYIAVGEFLRDVAGDDKTPQQEDHDVMAGLCIAVGTVLIVGLVLSTIFYAASGQ